MLLATFCFAAAATAGQGRRTANDDMTCEVNRYPRTQGPNLVISLSFQTRTGEGNASIGCVELPRMRCRKYMTDALNRAGNERARYAMGTTRILAAKRQIEEDGIIIRACRR